MKKLARPTLIFGLSLFLALFSASITCSAQAELPNLSGATLSVQSTATPAAKDKSKDKSEIGSTNEIVVMGGVIVLIIFAPIFVNRKNWK